MNSNIAKIIPIHPEVAELLKGQSEKIAQLQQQVFDLGRQNIALAAEEEGRKLAEQQLEAADKRIKELEAALVLASLPQDSRDNVIQMARAA